MSIQPIAACFILNGAISCALLGCRMESKPSADASDDPRDRFLAAFSGERYADALAIIDKDLANHADDPMPLAYRGACLTMLARYAEAVEAFRRAELVGRTPLSDKTLIYLRARSLFYERDYGRAQQELDRLNALYPNGRLSERGQELALQIERALAAGISTSNLNWYLTRGLAAHADAHSALAIEHLEEYLLLAGRLHSPPSSAAQLTQARLALGSAYLDFAAGDRARIHLDSLPPEMSDYQAAIYQAQALHATGDVAQAIARVKLAAEKTTSEEVRARASRLQAKWAGPAQ